RLNDRTKNSSQGRPKFVIDPLRGAPGVAAMGALSPFGRFVQLGAAAGPEAVVNSGIVRGRYLSILGYNSFVVPWEEQAAAYRKLLDYVGAGKLKVEVE